VIYARRLGAVPVLVPLREHRYDLDALAAAVTPRTKLVCIAHPNNPTGTSNGRAELLRFLDGIPEHVLTVLDQAYFEYVTDPDYLDGVEELVKQGRRVLVLRTFSKIYGLAGLRVGYGIGPADAVAAIAKVRRPFDLSTPAQAMALASLGDGDEVARRRGLNEQGRGAVEAALRAAGYEVAAPAVANFVYAEVGEDARPLYEALLREGVIVRPLHGFGAPGAIRVSVGTPEETEVFAAALTEVAARAAT
jgi:histidinol-phosphate aminotransferase